MYHQSLDDITEKNEEGYIVLNPDVIEGILKTKEEEEDTTGMGGNGQQVNDDDDDDDDLDCMEIQENESDESDCCIEVEGPIKREHEGELDESSSSKRSA